MIWWLAAAAIAALAVGRALRQGQTMDLNCKPGDTAVVFRAYNRTACARARVGMIVRVHSCVVGWSENDGQLVAEAAWLYDRVEQCKVCGGAIFALADSTLKPLVPEEAVWKHDYEQEEKNRAAPNLPVLWPPV